ncbi:hypothetical protein GWO43_24685 [candidate division KSB1 bacterium]|nr:hypothetical protein [candidate division KSB1 bacterium]NIR68639.1 hypothetical protein [candidate division KSB1 bacterium]NIS27128.1 hypothetical protein [candidate division KSB1 bacterium]NIT74014.1 hypothetical protein [candidate division KSB1 bacterium]NIU27880.1 hypothetical protein [candidate division KSB1 bacterium]
MFKNKLHELVDALPEHQVNTAQSFLEFLLKKEAHNQNNDLEILNRNSDYLNKEASDVLTYQVSL